MSNPLICGDCKNYPCDNSGAHRPKDKACDMFKPHEFTRPVEDKNGGSPGVVRFVKRKEGVQCTIQYPLKGEGFRETEPIVFNKLSNQIKDEIHRAFCGHCDVKDPTYIKLDLDAIYKELRGLRWYPKTWRTTPKTEEPTQDINPDNNGGIQADELDIPEEFRKAAIDEAMQVLKEGDPVGYIQETIKKIHIGDENAVEGLILAIANQSCSNSQGLQIKMSGSSGTGKTHLAKSIIHCVRKEHVHESTLSAKAAYYLNMKPGTILFCDDATISEEMEEMIKRASTNYQEVTTHTTVKDQNSKTLTIAARILWLLTSVDDDVSDQLLNRQLVFSTDETAEQKKRIAEMQLKEAMEGVIHTLYVNHEILVCREIFDHIKKSVHAVRIPYSDKLQLANYSNTRNLPIFLDMIKGYTVMMQEQREKDEEGYLLANLDDLMKAKRLIESQSESLITKLNDKERKILAVIKQTPGGADVNQITAKTGYTYHQVRDILEGRKRNGGMLLKVPKLKKIDINEIEKDDGGSKGERRILYTLDDKESTLQLYDLSFVRYAGD